MTAETKQFEGLYTELWDTRENSDTYYNVVGCILTRWHDDGRHEAFGFEASPGVAEVAMGARYEKGDARDGFDGTPYTVFDASGEMRSVVWNLKDAKAEVARIDDLGGTPTFEQLSPSSHAFMQKRKREHAARRALAACIESHSLEELAAELVARAQALQQVVESGDDPDGIGAEQRARDCAQVAGSLVRGLE